MIEGTCKCEKCGENYEWYYIVPDNINSSMYHVHVIPQDKEKVYQVLEKTEDRVPTKVSVYCPKCDILNTFDVEDTKNV